MTRREIKITRNVLDYLHALDHGQATEIQIHANAFSIWDAREPLPSPNELTAVLNNCATEKWIQGVPSKFAGKMKWNILDAGEAVRLELQ